MIYEHDDDLQIEPFYHIVLTPTYHSKRLSEQVHDQATNKKYISSLGSYVRTK